MLIHVEFTNINSYNPRVIFGNVWTMRNIKVTIWAIWVGIVDSGPIWTYIYMDLGGKYVFISVSWVLKTLSMKKVN